MLHEIEDIDWFKPLTSTNPARLKWLNDKNDNNNNKKPTEPLTSPTNDHPSLLVFDKNSTLENKDQIQNQNNNSDTYSKSCGQPQIVHAYFSSIIKNNNNTNNMCDTTATEMVTDQQIDFELYNVYRQKVIKALQKHKFFTMYTPCTAIREALLKRGWIEKCILQPSKEIQLVQNLPLTHLLKFAQNNNIYEMVLLSKIALRYNTNFIWQNRVCSDKGFDMLPYRNRIRRLKLLNFTTKEGLIGCIENAHWCIIDGISEINVPRFHNLTRTDELIEFQQDYRTTYCLSLIKYINDINNINILFDINGQISIDIFKFACDRINAEIKYRKRIDLDTDYELFEDNKYDDDKWNNFFMKVNRIINGIEKFRTSLEFVKEYCSIQCKILLKEANEFWPTLSSDGYNNLWILKPTAFCRGRGIIIKQNYNDIQYVLKHTDIPYIVQKYIERPLIIYKTKFDIRQFMLVTINETILSIWMYKDCYLRFSSQEYQLSDLNESVHLTNYAIQKKYKIGQRTDKIPSYNMWSLNEFEKYLTENGNNENIWNDKIYTGMKRNIIAIILASLEEIELKPNTFELYGCDFMIDENLTPILIEINASPDLSHTTPITAKICPAALEDLIKVVVDLPKNPNANTGNFELIYSICCEKPDKKDIQSVLKFEVSGKRMKIYKGEPIAKYNYILKRRIKTITKQNKQAATLNNTKKIIGKLTSEKKLKKNTVSDNKIRKKNLKI